ncbi:hypothetical protein Pelo_15122 [Pelomyxa schiedti]|nr:hypothetical protein Pelo_15122 [Pelomyxa schiedti]
MGSFSFLAAATLVVICGCAFVECWGPYTHQVFGSYASDEGLQNGPLVLGSSAPDAFKGLRSTMHGLVYAGYQLLCVLVNSSCTSASFDTYNFSVGYGGHLCEDMVGHHSDGYLTPEYDHELEFAVDTYLTKSTNGFDFRLLQDYGDPVYTFVAAASEFYSNYDTSFIPLNYTQAKDSADEFDNQCRLESPAIVANVAYKSEMVKWDNYGATSFAQAQQHLALAQNCAIEAANFWLQTMLDTHDPVSANQQTTSFVDSLFAAKKCTP